jgi:hypothetical protein
MQPMSLNMLASMMLPQARVEESRNITCSRLAGLGAISAQECATSSSDVTGAKPAAGRAADAGRWTPDRRR